MIITTIYGLCLVTTTKTRASIFRYVKPQEIKIDARCAFPGHTSNKMMNTTFQTTTISDFLDNFAGRRSMEHYDDTKPIKIAECNRDFVWSKTMQQDFISSILKGFPIPAMTIVNGQIVESKHNNVAFQEW